MAVWFWFHLNSHLFSEQVADLMLNLGYDIDIDVAQNLFQV